MIDPKSYLNTMTAEQLTLINLILLFTLKIIVFILGYLTIRLGYKLVKDGITGNFKFHTELKGYKAILQSGSPGLLFVLLGTMLIGYAMFTDKTIPYKNKKEQVKDTHISGQGTTKQDSTKKPNLGGFDSSQTKPKQ
ncbi:MAG: hypothetical protein JWR09_4249 [Mucilaginibacter sp.]|nr:hypothetical protein [Mucilaginibacter sp.]